MKIGQILPGVNEAGAELLTGYATLRYKLSPRVEAHLSCGVLEDGKSQIRLYFYVREGTFSMPWMTAYWQPWNQTTQQTVFFSSIPAAIAYAKARLPVVEDGIVKYDTAYKVSLLARVEPEAEKRKQLAQDPSVIRDQICHDLSK